MSVDDFDRYVEYKKHLTTEERRRLSILALRSGRFFGQELIGRMSRESLLTEREREVLEEELAKPVESHRAPHADFVAITKLTRLCNLRCTYCHSWAEGPNQIMQWRAMIQTVRSVVSMEGLERAQFVWHGGEVTLIKPLLMRKFIWLQYNLKPRRLKVANALQTNGTALTPEWIDFLIGLDINVGVSLDGPPEVNDKRRLRKDGRVTSDLIADGMRNLRVAGIPFGILIVLDKEICDQGARRLLNFVLDLEVDTVSLLNVLPENDAPHGSPGDHYLPYGDYVAFLLEVFNEWWPAYRDRVLFTDLSELMNGVAGHRHPVNCLWSGNCHGRFMTFEPNGDVAPCDKYRGDAGSLLGNVTVKSLGRLIEEAPYLHSARQFSADGAEEMKSCEWFQTCRGGCPHDRLLSSRHLPNFDGSCCGLRPLLNRMREAVREDEASKKIHGADWSLAAT